MENQLITEYKKIKDVLKERGGKENLSEFTKDKFMNYLFSKTEKSVFDEIIKEFTPKEFFINEAIKNDPKLKEKIFNLLKNE
jgi:hypothetical protein